MKKKDKTKASAACELPVVERPQAAIATVKQKIGESRGNLQRRSDWFEKRSGKK
jgi:hypothetical protein